MLNLIFCGRTFNYVHIKIDKKFTQVRKDLSGGNKFCENFAKS